MNRRRRTRAKRQRAIRRLRLEAAQVFYPARRRFLLRLRQMGASI